MGKQEGELGVGASTALFIAAPSLGSIVVSATLPQPTAPAARNTMPSPPCQPQIQLP